MGYLFTQGVFLVLGLAISFILLVVSLFVGHIILFDSIALGIIAGVCCNHFFTLHPSLCLLVGIAVFVALLFLQHTRFGFWIIGMLMSAVWALIFAFFRLHIRGGRYDMVLCSLGTGFHRYGGAAHQGKGKRINKE